MLYVRATGYYPSSFFHALSSHKTFHACPIPNPSDIAIKKSPNVPSIAPFLPDPKEREER
jgi:hypothetical protein